METFYMLEGVLANMLRLVCSMETFYMLEGVWRELTC